MKVTIEQAYEEYFDALLRGDRAAATSTALGALRQGIPADVIIEKLVSRGQAAVGHGWLHAQLSIATEHRASGIAESVLHAVTETALSSPTAPETGSAGNAVVACCEGEWHTLPGRIVTETLRLHGVETTFIGPSVPAADLAATLEQQAPPVVAVTCSMPMSLVGAWRTIGAARGLGATVVCGGRGFGSDGRWATALGADHWAEDASAGIPLVLEAQGRPRPSRRDHMPAVLTDEVNDLIDHHDAYAEAATALALELRGQGTIPGEMVQRIRFDLSHSLDAVTASVLVNDADLLIEHARWLEALLLSRGQSSRFVPTALSLQRQALPEHQVTARRNLDAAIAFCEQTPATSITDLS